MAKVRSADGERECTYRRMSDVCGNCGKTGGSHYTGPREFEDRTNSQSNYVSYCDSNKGPNGRNLRQEQQYRAFSYEMELTRDEGL